MFAGIDIGSLSCEAVIIDGNGIQSSAITPTGSFPRKSGLDALNIALNKAHITLKDIQFTVSTGYGRNLLPNVKAITEITCYARGASFLNPQVEMVIDIGGQDSKVITIDKNGKPSEFITNDKCAAGTGRFLETIARALGLQVDEMSLLGHDEEPATISSTCGVFAESEVVGLLASEIPIPKIVAGIHKSVVDRTIALVNKLSIRNHIMFCGGVSKNSGVRIALEKALAKPVIIPPEPQIIGALGAAIIAKEEYNKL
jgi:predicted CoA-substrate-specific enzyme activase